MDSVAVGGGAMMGVELTSGWRPKAASTTRGLSSLRDGVTESSKHKVVQLSIDGGALPYNGTLGSSK